MAVDRPAHLDKAAEDIAAARQQREQRDDPGQLRQHLGLVDARLERRRIGEQAIQPDVADDPAHDGREDDLGEPVACARRVLEYDGDANRIDRDADGRVTVEPRDQDVGQLV